jgi:hypothetical protein
MSREMRLALIGALLMGALSTLYDFFWAWWITRHRAGYGLVHGMTLLAGVGAVLGWRAGRLGRGLVLGAAAGFGAAAAYYLLAALHVPMGAAMLAAWALFWLALALGDDRWLRGGIGGPGAAVVRGLAAAVLSGLTFAWAARQLWLRGGDYPLGMMNFLWWTLAFLPGFVALLAGSRGRVRQ